jgi:hypothetical protein
MTTLTLTFKVPVTDIAPELTTRPIGIQARERLIQALEDYEFVEIDFLGKSLTPSFADECIGRLAAFIGLKEFQKRVKMTNVSASTKPLIKHVILARCSPNAQ